MFYLVATPIGNLADFTYRAVDLLKSCSYILCEDTRHSQRLLEHYAINTPLRSFHKFNEREKQDLILEDLKQGQKIALISDAGTPLISDPGEQIVARCRAEGIPVTALPGASAATCALILSGMPTTPFQFVGFLPKKSGELKNALSKILLYAGTTVAYETPHRIEETLNVLQTLSPDSKLCIARELTKLYEECLLGTAEELLAHFSKHPPRGEMVLVIGPSKEELLYAELSLAELVERLQKEFNLDKREAIKMAAQMRNLPKREVYKQFVQD